MMLPWYRIVYRTQPEVPLRVLGLFSAFFFVVFTPFVHHSAVRDSDRGWQNGATPHPPPLLRTELLFTWTSIPSAMSTLTTLLTTFMFFPVFALGSFLYERSVYTFCFPSTRFKNNGVLRMFFLCTTTKEMTLSFSYRWLISCRQ